MHVRIDPGSGILRASALWNRHHGWIVLHVPLNADRCDQEAIIRPAPLRRWFAYVRLAVAVGAAWALCGSTAVALGARVVVLGPHGHAGVRNDPFLALPAVTPAPVQSPAAQATGVKPRSAVAKRNVRTELARLFRTHQIDRSDYKRYGASLIAAENAAKHLRGTRAAELEAVIENLHVIAAASKLTRSRLPALFLTLDRNRQWWTTGPLLSSGQRVEFSGSQVVWEYYVGQGIELQELGSFGKADGLSKAGPGYSPQGRALLAELIPLAANRAGGLTWEYYFNFDGGVPPWTSAMSQGTALAALADAYRASGNTSYLGIARRALPVLRTAPPVGVSVKTRLGNRYLLYSFARGAAVINGFLQTLIGLQDYAVLSGDQVAARLFAAGDAEARAEVPRYDTGAWSLYQPGEEDTLDYHTLVTGFLAQLCSSTHAAVYCTTAAHFQDYLKIPPILRLLTRHLPLGSSAVVRFQLSKASHVGITLLRDGKTAFLTSANFSYGINRFTIPPLTHAGGYTVRLGAIDLAGNYNRIAGTLQVSR
ncbi:MAG: D-glucuronyl C5-epimerase family protein [Solirubrobacteraceae bacterium]